MTTTEKPFGRPTDYREEYCDMIINMGSQGMSITQIARSLGVHRDTIYEWRDRHPRFSDALKKSREFAQGWWEEEGHKNLHSKSFNHVLWYMNMKNRFRTEWYEKTDSTPNDSSEIDKDRELLNKCRREA